MYKIAVFTDIHGNLEALEAILANIKQDDYDEIICLGDIIGIGPNSKECLDIILNSRNIKLVLGNYERYYLNGVHNELKMSEKEKVYQRFLEEEIGNDYKLKLSKIGLEKNLIIDNQKICFMHYPYSKIDNNFYTPRNLTAENIKIMLKNNNSKIVIFGHSHKEQVLTESENVYINMASSGCTEDDVTSYDIIEYDGKDFKIYNRKCIYDKEKYNQKMLTEKEKYKKYINNIYEG